jgi:hypothetical protein
MRTRLASRRLGLARLIPKYSDIRRTVPAQNRAADAPVNDQSAGADGLAERHRLSYQIGTRPAPQCQVNNRRGL